VKDRGLRPWLSVIAGGESLVSHAGATLLVEAARRSGLTKELSSRLGRWRRPLATRRRLSAASSCWRCVRESGPLDAPRCVGRDGAFAIKAALASNHVPSGATAQDPSRAVRVLRRYCEQSIRSQHAGPAVTRE